MSLLRHRRYALARRILVIAATCGLLAGTFGVPVVLTESNKKDRSQPYPCMDHACGCRSAEACWRNCCCFTNAQKLVWAAEHGVKPPEYVYAAAAEEHPAVAMGRCCESHGKSCCEEKKSCCRHVASHSHDATDEAEEEIERSNGWSIEFVSAIEARKCRGQAELWLSLGAVAPPPARVELNLEQIVLGRMGNVAESLVSVAHSPDSPPPRG